MLLALPNLTPVAGRERGERRVYVVEFPDLEQFLIVRSTAGVVLLPWEGRWRRTQWICGSGCLRAWDAGLDAESVAAKYEVSRDTDG